MISGPSPYSQVAFSSSPDQSANRASSPCLTPRFPRNSVISKFFEAGQSTTRCFQAARRLVHIFNESRKRNRTLFPDLTLIS
ncbi:hypothetical protein H5410_021211 [Solanum commersonii]|uniref:Uncharacterized protein n=1 Tax=Solanum commersonii TaxID=4109 RepID=A0A9J5ZBA6_SOLCO|nr:hypothetical protein H5410_021211 [Solanum commersonii]